jgi:hypothetical protein
MQQIDVLSFLGYIVRSMLRSAGNSLVAFGMHASLPKSRSSRQGSATGLPWQSTSDVRFEIGRGVGVAGWGAAAAAAPWPSSTGMN